MRVNFWRRLPTSEFRLLVECCRWSFAAGGRDEIDALIGSADWPRFAALSRRHRVQGLVWQCLRNFEAGIPAPIIETLSEQASSVARHNLQSAHLCKSLLRAFDDAGIPLLFLKGLTLSQLAYDDPFLKMGWDVDVLVEPGAIEAAARELLNLGLQPVIPPDAASIREWHRRRKESVWRSPEGLHVELHSRLADNPAMLPSIGMGSPSKPVRVAPGIELPTLTLEDLFAYLCVHGASSAWFRLKWITDFAALFHDCAPDRLEHSYHHALDAGAGYAVDQALLLSARIYGSPAPVRQSGRAGRWLAAIAWDQLLRDQEPTATALGTLPIHYSQLLLRPGLRFKFVEAARQLSDWAGKPR